jgi:hypothetical protein
MICAMLPVSGCHQAGSPHCDALHSADAQWSSAQASLRSKEAASRLVATLKRIEETAPDEERPDWVVLETLFERFTVYDPDLTDLTPQMQAFESAAKRIEAHATETCGIDLGQ